MTALKASPPYCPLWCPHDPTQSQAIRKDLYNPKPRGRRVGSTHGCSREAPKHGNGFSKLHEVLAQGLEVGLLTCCLRGPGLQPRVLADEVGEAGGKGTSRGTRSEGGGTSVGGGQKGWAIGVHNPVRDTGESQVWGEGMPGCRCHHRHVSPDLPMTPMSNVTHVPCPPYPMSPMSHV